MTKGHLKMTSKSMAENCSNGTDEDFYVLASKIGILSG